MAGKRSYKACSEAEYIPFQPKKHLLQEPPEKCYTMEELGYNNNSGISPMAVSSPFRLFTEEAVQLMREEIFNEEVHERFTFTSDLAAKQLRGYAPSHAKFIAEAWKHPETLKLISKIAGIDLVPVMDYELGHINISVEQSGATTVHEEDQPPVVGWHRDSYPFVCVLMMSDTKGMRGGETALKQHNGEIIRVRGPDKGSAVVLQGRYIEHQALRAHGMAERITMVTSFRPRDPLVRDDTVLNTVRPVSNLSELYGQVAEYQLENMGFRVRRMQEHVKKTRRDGATDVKGLKAFLAEEIRILNHLQAEIVEDVKKGAVLIEVKNEAKEDAALASRRAKRVRKY